MESSGHSISPGRFDQYMYPAYRKTENKQYIPNVFVPTSKITSDDINFVDPKIYERCRRFFDDILQLQKPNEYEFFIKDIKKR